MDSEDDLIIHFVRCESSGSQTMLSVQQAFEYARSLQLKCKWITEDDCVAFHSFKKSHVFVFEQFEGRGFEAIDLYSCSLIINSRCLLYCLTENVRIPISKYPIFSMAMSGLVVTSSGVPREQKERIKNLVHYMGGQYTNAFLDSTTNLITSTVLSKKYTKACEINIPVMKPEWIFAIWEANSKEMNIHGTDTQFEQFKCPIFHNLIITSSRLSRTQRADITHHVNSNGGTYTSDMETDKTNILVIIEPAGEKYKHARKCNIPCIKPTWIYACIEKGYAVPYGNHKLQDKPQCSTPARPDIMLNMPNFYETQTHISVIHDPTEKGVINHTVTTANTILGTATPKKGLSYKPYHQIIESLNILDAKRSGGCLDGCKVYLSGFTTGEEEKLKRILNYSGAIRFTDLNESVTHVIVGNYNKTNDKQQEILQKRYNVVTLEWLKDSLIQKCVMPESNYNFMQNIFQENSPLVIEQPSPLSKKGLQILTPQKINTQEETIVNNLLNDADEDLIRNYIEQPDEGSRLPEIANRPMPEEGNMHNQPPKNCLGNKNLILEGSQETNIDQIFRGFMFEVKDHDLEATNKIVDKITGCGGKIVEDIRTANIDYIIVPISQFDAISKFPHSQVVTFIWLNDCLSNKKIIPVMYYHQPTEIPQLNVMLMSDCVITFSSYVPAEKIFIEHIAVALGAKCQDVLSKKVNLKANALKTTHLICPVPASEKYRAAKKWGLPVVTKEWLFECLKKHQKVPVEAFLVTENDQNNYESRIDDTAIKMVDATTKLMPDLAKPSSNNSGLNLQKPAAQSSNSQNKFKIFTPPQFPRLENLNISNSHLNPLNCENDVVVTASCVTAPTTAVITTTSKMNLINTTTNTVSVCNGYVENSFSKTTTGKMTSKLTPVNKNVTSNKGPAEVENLKQSTPDGLLQKVKQMSQLISDSSVPKPKENIAAKYIFADPSRCEKRKFIDEEKHQQEVCWNDPFSDTNSKKMRSEEEDENYAPKNFVLSNFIDSLEKKEVEEKIKKLGGNVLTGNYFEKECTHLITKQLIKSEKILCCIAAGKWVLHPTYVKESENSKKFLKEEDYEWGNNLVKNKFLLPTDVVVRNLADAAVRWRKCISNNNNCSVENKIPSRSEKLNNNNKIFKGGAFAGVKAVFLTDAHHAAAFSRVVEAGGGEVYQQSRILDATHYFIGTDNKFMNNIPVRLKLLAEKQIHVLPTTYLNDYLTLDPIPDPQKFYINAYKNVISKF